MTDTVLNDDVKQLKKTIRYIVKWAEKLHLNKSSVIHQNLKIQEEFGELAKSINKNDVLAIMDGLGDTIVVATVMTTIINSNNGSNNYYDFYDFIKLPKMLSSENTDKYFEFYHLSYKLNDFIDTCVFIKKCSNMVFSYANLISQCYYLANVLNLNLLDCVKMAYTTISFRSGEIIDGIFVKREPLATIIVPVSILKEDIDDILKSINEYANKENIKIFKIEFSLENTELTYKGK